MNRTEFIITLGAAIVGALQLIFEIFQWFFPNPSALAPFSTFIQIISLVGVLVLVIVIWHKAFSVQPNNAWKNTLLGLSLLAITYAAWIGTQFNILRANNNETLPIYSQISTVAWQALLSDEYELANSVTDICIANYGLEAVRIQEGLTASRETEPPIGQVDDESIKAKISAHGILNDVAACYYIKAEAMKKLTRTDEAKAAYQNTQKFPHARVFDPETNLYWSPAQTATEKLIQLP